MAPGQVRTAFTPRQTAVGSLVRLTADFVNLLDVATDPTTITLKLKQSDASLVTYVYPTVIVKSAVGSYYADVALTLAGIWTYRWEGTGALQAADEGTISVRGSAFS